MFGATYGTASYGSLEPEGQAAAVVIPIHLQPPMLWYFDIECPPSGVLGVGGPPSRTSVNCPRPTVQISSGWQTNINMPPPRITGTGSEILTVLGTAELTTLVPALTAHSGANVRLSSPTPSLQLAATSVIWGQINATCQTPNLSITGSFATQGRATLTFGYFNGGNYSISAAVGAKTTLSAPAAMVSAFSTTGSSGRAALQLTSPTTSGYSGLVASLVLPKATLTVSMVEGNTAVIVTPKFSAFALGKTGGVGKAITAISYTSLAAYSGGSAYLTPQAPYINSAIRTGTLGFAELRSSRVSVSACSGASGNLRSGRCSVSANSRVGGVGRMTLNMTNPSASGHWGGHFYGVLP